MFGFEKDRKRNQEQQQQLSAEKEFHSTLNTVDKMIEENKGVEALKTLNQYLTQIALDPSKDSNGHRMKVIKTKIKMIKALELLNPEPKKAPTLNK